MDKFTLSCCAETMFTDLSMVERVKKISELGFLPELWDWTNHDIDALASTGVTFSSMTGYIEGDFLENSDRLLTTIHESVAVAKKLRVPRLNLHGTGLDNKGLPVNPRLVVSGRDWIKAYKVLSDIAEIGAQNDVMFVLENLNLKVDHPGSPFATAEDVFTLVSEINHPNLKMMLDLYHQQIDEGNILDSLTRYLPQIGEIQIADVPGRQEPGTGEMNYPAIAQHLRKIGYKGVVGFEGFPSDDSRLALERFEKAFN
ncbi:TIM barrel protein [Marinomonas sp. TW1]|uniref:TIM barrel protein n=1 Tax=Marinomonas sp. TW1 TaxID=1561203 RepID=UPI000A877C27|nr:TIM barrel protein [Marinomonas sp. TW1]